MKLLNLITAILLLAFYAKADNIYFQLSETPITRPDSSEWKILESDLNLGFYKGEVWFKIELNKDPSQDSSLIIFENPLIDELYLYSNTFEQVDKIGDNLELSFGSYRIPTFTIPRNDTTVYVSLYNYGEQLHVPVKLLDQETFNKNELNNLILYGVYFGIILFAIGFNLFIAIVLKEKGIYKYLAYLGFNLVLQLALLGLGHQFIWGNNIYLNNRSTIIYSSLAVYFLLQFTRNFLNLKKHLPKVNQFLGISSWIVLLNIVLALIASNSWIKIPIVIINAFTLLFGTIIIPISYHIYRKRIAAAKFFLLAFIVLILGVITFVLRNSGILGNSILANNGLLVGSALEVILLTFAIIDKFKSFKDDALRRLKEINIIKENANTELETKVKLRTKELASSNEQLSIQKEIIQEKNIELTDSINYAKRIQNAIIPKAESLFGNKTDGFVMFKPKDIVSGDFYWSYRNDHFQYYAVIDCTGHGVPGAFMSFIGNTLLNEIVGKNTNHPPAEILNQLRDGVIKTLNQAKDQSNLKDGMDMSLIRINHKNMEVQFAGAQSPIYISSNKEKQEIEASKNFELNDSFLYEMKGDRMPIGSYLNNEKSFSNHLFILEKGDRIFLFTDGYADQFGGPKEKKLKYSTLRQIILSHQNQSMTETKRGIEEYFKHWINEGRLLNPDLIQIDDVCVMGIELI